MFKILLDEFVIDVDVTEADVFNLNGRSYTASSLKQACDDAQKLVELGLLTIYDNHPDAVYDSNGEPVGFNHRQNEPLGRVKNLLFDKTTGKVIAKAVVFDTEQGRRIQEIVRAGKQVSVSLRALSSGCTQTTNGQVCDIERIDGFDVVENPALPSAAITGYLITDSSELSNKSCSCHKQPPTTINDGKTMNTDLVELLKQAGAPDNVLALINAYMLGQQEDEVENETEDQIEPDAEEPQQNDAVYDEVIRKVEQHNVELSKEVLEKLSLLEVDLKFRQEREAIRDAVSSVVESAQVGDLTFSSLPISKVEALAKDILSNSSVKTKDDALDRLHMGIKLLLDADLQRRAVNLPNTQPMGRTVENVREGESWREHYDKAMAVLLDYRNRQDRREGARIEEYKKINSSLRDKATNWFLQEEGGSKSLFSWDRAQRQAVTDGRVITDFVIGEGVNANDLRNQPLLSLMFIDVLYQRLSAIQYTQQLGPSDGIGGEFKIPSKAYATPVGTNFGYNSSRYISGSDPIPQASIKSYFQSFWAEQRGTAFAISQELDRQLRKGIFGLDATAMLIEETTKDLARVIDTDILREMHLTCDEFQSIAVANEVSQAGDLIAAGTNTVSYLDGGESVTVTYGPAITNIVKIRQLDGDKRQRPIVKPRNIKSYDASGTKVGITINPITCVVNGATLVRGELNPLGNIEPINTGDTPTYAVDYERGLLIFTAGAGVAAGTLPTISYSYATNYVNFNLSPGIVLPEDYYNKLINLVMQTAGVMSSSPRYVIPDVLLNPRAIGQGAIGIASIFHKRKSPNWIALNAGFAFQDTLGEMSGIAMMMSNGTFFAGDRRSILMRNEMTGFGVQMPAEIKGPHPVFASNQLLTAATQFAVISSDVIGTPVPKDVNNVTVNHPGKTIRYYGNLSV